LVASPSVTPPDGFTAPDVRVSEECPPLALVRTPPLRGTLGPARGPTRVVHKLRTAVR
jgi:hypothetical protein